MASAIVQGITWCEFIARLEDLDWTDPSYPAHASCEVEDAVRRLAASPAEIEQHVERILADPELFRRYAPHCEYPRILMDKFVIYIDPEDRFRVRLHRFKGTIENGGHTEKVHSHKWPGSSAILRGCYRERRFEVLECDDDRLTATVVQVGDRRYRQGDTMSIPPLVPHQVVNESPDEACLTIFVRGPSFYRGTRVFDVPAGTFYYTYPPEDQLRWGLRMMGRLDPSFGP